MEAVLTDENDERFIELSNRLNDEYYENIGDEALKYLDYNKLDEPHFVILVLNWDRAIACASFRVIDLTSIEIRRVFVSKRHRKKGIAYKMVKQLEKLAIENGFKNSYIVTGNENEAALNLYKKLDYEFIDNFGMFEGDDLCVCMKKEFRSLI